MNQYPPEHPIAILEKVNHWATRACLLGAVGLELQRQVLKTNATCFEASIRDNEAPITPSMLERLPDQDAFRFP